jgi:hypothetical protein
VVGHFLNFYLMINQQLFSQICCRKFFTAQH